MFGDGTAIRLQCASTSSRRKMFINDWVQTIGKNVHEIYSMSKCFEKIKTKDNWFSSLLPNKLHLLFIIFFNSHNMSLIQKYKSMPVKKIFYIL